MARSLPVPDDALADEVYGREATAFVHVGRPADPTMRALARFAGPDDSLGFAFVGGETVLFPPAPFLEDAKRRFPGDAVVDPSSLEAPSVAEGVAEFLADRRDGGTVLVPRHLPHDAALFLEQAGFDLTSSDVVDRVRYVKTPAEVDRVRRVQAAAETAMGRVAGVLADATSDGDLRHDGATLSTERLRRIANAALAGEGVDPAGNTTVAAGKGAARVRFGGDVPIRAGDTVVVDLTPRGSQGYHTDFARTFVVDTDGGWDRRAHVAVAEGIDAGIETARPGERAAAVHQAVAGEIHTFGFPTDPSRDVGFTHDGVHGIGLACREAPTPESGDTLEAGVVLAVEGGVYDPTEGGVRLEEPVLVTEDGPERLTDASRSLRPENW